MWLYHNITTFFAVDSIAYRSSLDIVTTANTVLRPLIFISFGNMLLLKLDLPNCKLCCSLLLQGVVVFGFIVFNS